MFSDADIDAPFVRLADAAMRIGPPAAAESYLDIEAVIGAAKELGADLIHPGYGFLSEDAGFAQACEQAGLIFVGPSAEVLRLMGNKDEAKRVAESAGVPVLAGYAGRDQGDDAFVRAAMEIGFPLIVKPVAGGGGKGMAVVNSADALPYSLQGARRVAQAAFADDRLMIEKFLLDPKHVEVQVLADGYGNVVHLGERDCSAQRRHQKILEETPAVSIDGETRTTLTDSAVALARVVGYRNAGTCEFLVSDGTVAFMEMNARLQVEHPVTELVTGLDLVEMQLRIATNETLPLTQEQVSFNGHAIEVRLYAEDPSQDFLPQAGTIHHLRFPDGVRVDSGIEEGSRITTHYDPMIAKLIVHAASRVEALEKLSAALDDVEVLGIATNATFLSGFIAIEELARGTVTTSTVDTLPALVVPAAYADEVLFLAAAAEANHLADVQSIDPWGNAGAWRLGGRAPIEVIVRPVGAETEELSIMVSGQGPYRVGTTTIARVEGCHSWTLDDESASVARGVGRWYVWWNKCAYEVLIGHQTRTTDASTASHLMAPMPGQVLAIRVEAKERVSKGQELVVVEAMKMEHSIKAPFDGVVKAVLCAVGESVSKGKVLVDLETD